MIVLAVMTCAVSAICSSAGCNDMRTGGSATRDSAGCNDMSCECHM